MSSIPPLSSGYPLPLVSDSQQTAQTSSPAGKNSYFNVVDTLDISPQARQFVAQTVNQADTASQANSQTPQLSSGIERMGSGMYHLRGLHQSSATSLVNGIDPTGSEDPLLALLSTQNSGSSSGTTANSTDPLLALLSTQNSGASSGTTANSTDPLLSLLSTQSN